MRVVFEGGFFCSKHLCGYNRGQLCSVIIEGSCARGPVLMEEIWYSVHHTTLVLSSSERTGMANGRLIFLVWYSLIKDVTKLQEIQCISNAY